jgi:hypothetical protein
MVCQPAQAAHPTRAHRPQAPLHFVVARTVAARQDAGLLEGSAGIQMVLHTTAANEPSEIRWDACLLLRG